MNHWSSAFASLSGLEQSHASWGDCSRTIFLSYSYSMVMTEISASQPYEWTFRRVVWATLVFALVVFCFWLVYRFYEVAFTLFIAIVLGTVIRPVADWLAQRGV